MLRRWLELAVRSRFSQALEPGLTGAVSALCLVALCQQVWLLWGTSIPVSLAVCVAVALGWAAGCSHLPLTKKHSSELEELLCRLSLAAWVVASPWCVSAMNRLSARADLFDPAGAGRNALIVLACSLALLGVPAFLTARLGRAVALSSTGALPMAAHFWGAAAGLLVWCLGTAQVAGPYLAAVAAAALGLVPTVWRLVRPASEKETSTNENATAISEPTNSSPTGFFGRFSLALEAGVALCLGGLLAASTRLLEQVVPSTLYLGCAVAIGVLAGLGLGQLIGPWVMRRMGSAEKVRLFCCAGTAVWGVAALAAFPYFVQGALWLSAYIASPTLLLLGRGALAVVLVLPLGLAAGFCLVSPGNGHSPVRLLTRAWILCAGMGYCLIAPAGERGVSVDLAFVGLCWGLLAMGAARWLRSEVLPASWIGRGLTASMVLIVLASPVWRERFNSSLSARVLFNTGAFMAYRAGFGTDLLPYVDDGRLVAEVPGARGVMTVWKHGGKQLQFRHDGMPEGLVSCDPALFPRFLPATLQVALPLVLHEKPHSLLLLGIETGEPLSAALAFPLQQVVCWEPDAAQVGAVRDVVPRHVGTNPLEDDRVTVRICDPALALDAEQGQFDTVVSIPDQPALLRTQAYFTREFYERCARRLAPEGVFCQRLQYIDLGPHPLAVILRTLQAVFPDCMAIECAPGEMLLVATNSPQGLLRPGLVERIERPHMRALLAESGLDWSVLLNIRAYRQDQIAKFCANVRHPNSAESSRFPLSLPREVMRWSPKLQEVFTALQPHAGRIASWIGEEGDSPVLVRRLAEVTGQNELMAKYNDQYWAYRASLRAQVTKKPRSQIRQASASTDEKQLHPEDRRRLAYFTALGKAVKTKSPADIQRLARFESPYDPLLSYFVHLEAAELYAKSKERDVPAELRHRLHATWYSSPRDASLRNVLDTLRLLREHPEVEPEPQNRWDQFNALLQAAQQRWEARNGTRPRNIKATIDEIDATVLATETTFETLAELAPQAGVTAAEWTARRNVLERTLIRQIKNYRSELLPHLHRRKGGKSAADLEAEVDVESSSAADAVAVPR